MVRSGFWLIRYSAILKQPPIIMGGCKKVATTIRVFISGGYGSLKKESIFSLTRVTHLVFPTATGLPNRIKRTSDFCIATWLFPILQSIIDCCFTRSIVFGRLLWASLHKRKHAITYAYIWGLHPLSAGVYRV